MFHLTKGRLKSALKNLSLIFLPARCLVQYVVQDVLFKIRFSWINSFLCLLLVIIFCLKLYLIKHKWHHRRIQWLPFLFMAASLGSLGHNYLRFTVNGLIMWMFQLANVNDTRSGRPITNWKPTAESHYNQAQCTKVRNLFWKAQKWDVLMSLFIE